MPTRVLKLAVTWVVLLGLWLLFVGELKVSELLAGAAAAALATGGVAVLQGLRFARFSPTLRGLALFRYEPRSILKDTAAVWRHGAKAIFGIKPRPEMRAIAFRAGKDDEESASRRVLATVLVTIPPNTIVVGIDRQQQMILVHFLQPDENPAVLKELEATG